MIEEEIIRPKILITFNDVGSSEYTLEVDPTVTANQLWVVSKYIDFWATQVHTERRMASFMERQKQMEMEKPKIFIPKSDLSKPN